MSTRVRLNNRRANCTFELHHGKFNTPFAVTIGYHDDGSVGEVFIAGARAGSEIDAGARDGAVLLSLAVQYGVPIDVMRGAITREANGAPSTIIGAVLDRLTT